MQRTTIDFGIDLGTTNSAISVMNEGKIETLKNGLSEVLPSCVYIDKKGNTHVGASAGTRLSNPKSAGDVHAEFKRTMGTEKQYVFQTQGISLSSEELSAKVLSELRATAASRFNADPPLAAIITIPAMFESPQRTATAKAGTLAGFEHVELLQEPVAAAVAAGFQSDADKAFWIVFDFGGGTFDASVVSIRDGQLTVVEHAGDNFLGGANLDWTILEQVLLPHLAEQGDISHLTRANMEEDASIRAQMYKLKLEAEQIKFALSKQETIEHFVEDAVEDAEGESLDIDITVPRQHVNSAIEWLVERAVEMTRELIDKANLQASDIEKVVMVGGTTYVPLVREKVAELGIEVDCSHDPMTIVARGAAIYAASRPMPENISEAQAPKTGLRVQLEYVPVVKSDTSPVGGKITTADGTSLPEGLQLTIKRQDGGWEIASVAIDAAGLFFTDVALVPSQASGFELVARDGAGKQLEIAPNSFTVTYGMTVGRAALPQTIRLCKADNTTEVLAASGASLPLQVNKLHVRTVEALAAGSDGKLRIPFAEGDELLADRNREGSVVVIKGTDVHKNLPAGTLIEISGEVNVSGLFAASCFIEAIDDNFKSEGNLLEFNTDSYLAHLNRIHAQVEALAPKVERADDPHAKAEFQKITASGQLEAIETLIEESNGEESQLGEARNQMVSIQRELDAIEVVVDWPAILAKYREEVQKTRETVEELGGEKDRADLVTLEADGDREVAEKDGKQLKAATERFTSLRFRLWFRQPDFWISILADLARREHEFIDVDQARALLRQSQRAVQARDVDTMESIVRQLWNLLPPDAAAESRQSGFGSDVI